MLPDAVQERAQRLLAVDLRERDAEFANARARTDSQFVARGAYRSSSRCFAIHQLFAREFAIRSQLAWNSLLRALTAMGVPQLEHTAESLKSFMEARLASIYESLEGAHTAAIEASGHSSESMRRQLNLADIRDHLRDKFDVEADQYVDGLKSRTAQSQTGTAPSVTVHGNVGAILTGAGAEAHVVQHLSPDDRQALIEAITAVREAIDAATELGDRRTELADVADDVIAIVRSEQPNNSKLRGLLGVLANTIQTIASAGPAYQAFKAALLPLGIHLP